MQRRLTGLSGLYSDEDVEVRMPIHKKVLAHNFYGEMATAIIVGIVSFPLGVLSQFVPLYHIPRDVFGVHSNVCVGMLVFLYSTLAIYGILRARPTTLREIGEREQNHQRAKAPSPAKWHIDEVFVALAIHFTFYICLVMFADPQRVRATGLHQEVAPHDCHSSMTLNESIGVLGMPDTQCTT